MSFELPPIVKCAERMLVEIEQAVRSFPRYHKYVIGTELRQQAMSVARSAHRAWRDREHQTEHTIQLARAIDDMKLTLQLGQQIKAFASFAQFEALARVLADLGRQCGGWQKQQRSKRQNAQASGPGQRPQILSARAAEGASP